MKYHLVGLLFLTSLGVSSESNAESTGVISSQKNPSNHSEPSQIRSLANEFLAQRKIQILMSEDALVKGLDYGVIDYGHGPADCVERLGYETADYCTTYSIPLVLYPENCAPKNFDKVAECREEPIYKDPSWRGTNTWMYFYINNDRKIQIIELRATQVLEEL